jgi:hypothetical protein
MRRFYKQTLGIPQNLLLTNQDLHHGLLVLLCYKVDTLVSITLALGSGMQYVEVDEPPPAEFLASA